MMTVALIVLGLAGVCFALMCLYGTQGSGSCRRYRNGCDSSWYDDYSYAGRDEQTWFDWSEWGVFDCDGDGVFGDFFDGDSD